MMAFHLWINRNIDVILMVSAVLAILVLTMGCAATLPPEPPPAMAEIKGIDVVDFLFCKAGIGGDYRILVPQNREELPVLALFSVGGPYDKDHVLCVISGDHAILDLGKGKQS